MAAAQDGVVLLVRPGLYTDATCFLYSTVFIEAIPANSTLVLRRASTVSS